MSKSKQTNKQACVCTGAAFCDLESCPHKKEHEIIESCRLPCGTSRCLDVSKQDDSELEQRLRLREDYAKLLKKARISMRDLEAKRAYNNGRILALKNKSKK
jgi:hypothetical protein